MAEPKPTPAPTPAVVEPFNPGKAKGGGYNPDVTGGVSVPGRGTLDSQSSGGKGVWFLRPETRTDIYVPGGTGPQQMAEYEAQAANQYYDPADLVGAYDSLDPNIQDLFTVVAKSQGGRSGSALFTRYVRESKRLSDSGIRKSPLDIVYGVAYKKGILKDDGTFTAPEDMESGGGRNRGGYTGPTATRTFANEEDLRRTADTLGAELLGRAVTEDEFKRVMKKIRSAETSQPTVTTSTPGSTMSQQGLTAEGRGDIMRDIIAKGPEAQEFTKATEVVGWFNEWLERRTG